MKDYLVERVLRKLFASKIKKKISDPFQKISLSKESKKLSKGIKIKKYREGEITDFERYEAELKAEEYVSKVKNDNQFNLKRGKILKLKKEED